MKPKYYFLLCLIITGCSPNYDHIDLDKVRNEADLLFKEHDDKVIFSVDLTDETPYLKDLKPLRVVYRPDGLSLVLKRSGVESSGLFILRFGFPPRNRPNAGYSEISDRVYSWEDRG